MGQFGPIPTCRIPIDRQRLRATCNSKPDSRVGPSNSPTPGFTETRFQCPQAPPPSSAPRGPPPHRNGVVLGVRAWNPVWRKRPAMSRRSPMSRESCTRMRSQFRSCSPRGLPRPDSDTSYMLDTVEGPRSRPRKGRLFCIPGRTIRENATPANVPSPARSSNPQPVLPTAKSPTSPLRTPNPSQGEHRAIRTRQRPSTPEGDTDGSRHEARPTGCVIRDEFGGSPAAPGPSSAER